MSLVTPDVNNDISYLDMLNEILFTSVVNNSQTPLRVLEQFFTWVESISASEIRKKIFIYFLDNKASTVPVLIKTLDVCYKSAYREVNILESKGILEKIINAKYIKKKTGRSPAIWGLVGQYRPDDVIQAIERHKYRNNKGYKLIEKISQSILDDFVIIDNKIYEKDIESVVRKYCKGFYHADITKQVAVALVKKGIRVIRVV